MSKDEQEVETAARRFYAAIEDIVSGRGLSAMEAAWHHSDLATSKHPSGEWSQGWEEVWATWNVFSAFGRADRGGSKLLSVTPYVYGDMAYTTSVFQASPAWGAEKIMCTNVFSCMDGAWKVIHHHADPSPAMGAALEKMLEG